YWANRGGAETAAELAKLRTGLDQFPRDEQARLLRGLAETYTRLGDRATAAKLWEELAAQPRYKADLRLRLVLFNLALQARDQDAMKRHLAEIRTLEGDDGTFYRYGEACRLIRLAAQGEKQHLDAARAHLDAVAARRPGWPAALLAKAELEELKGN